MRSKPETKPETKKAVEEAREELKRADMGAFDRALRVLVKVTSGKKPRNKLKATTRFAIAALVVIASASPLLATAYPDCQGWKPPAELKGKKAIESNFVGPSGGAVIILRIGHKILCESAEPGVPAKERLEAERQVMTGKMHKPTTEDFSVGSAGMGDCEDLHYDCYDKSSPNYGDPQPCSEFAAHCR